MSTTHEIKPCASAPWWNWKIRFKGKVTYDHCEPSRQEAIDAVRRIRGRDAVRDEDVPATHPAGIPVRRVPTPETEG